MADLARALHRPVDDGLDGGLVLRLGHQVLRASCASSRTSTPTSPAGTSWSSRTSSTPGSPCRGCCATCARAGPASVEVFTLLRKPEAATGRRVASRYVGFDIPNEFVVGYGLDYAERYRNLPFVARSPRTSTPERNRTLTRAGVGRRRGRPVGRRATLVLRTTVMSPVGPRFRRIGASPSRDGREALLPRPVLWIAVVVVVLFALQLHLEQRLGRRGRHLERSSR